MGSIGKISAAGVRNWWAQWGLPVAGTLCIADLGLIGVMGVRGGLGEWGLALAADVLLSAFIGVFLGWTALALRRENAALQQAQAALRESLGEHRQALLRERELSKELDHRVRNNVAGLLGLVTLYERSGKDGAQVARAIRGKLRAMHEVHNIITRTQGRTVGFDALVRRLAAELTPADSGAVVTMEGPVLDVPSPQAGALAVIVHELFANSQKHGALSGARGEVKIAWTVTPGLGNSVLELDWSETAPGGGGERVMDQGHAGVGLSLIKGFAESDLRGSFERTISPGSFQCRLRATIDARGAEAVKE